MDDLDSTAATLLGPLGDPALKSRNDAAPKQDETLEGQAERLLSPISKIDEGSLAPSTAQSKWGPIMSLLNGMMLGGGKSVLATNPQSFSDIPSFDPERAEKDPIKGFAKRKEDLAVEQAAFHREHPGQDLAAELAGSTLTTLPAMALGQGYLAAPLAAKLGLYGGKIANAAGRLLGGGVQGAIGGGMTSGLNDNSVGENMLTGAATGGVLNTVMGPLAGKLASSIPDSVKDMARRAVAQGIPIRTGQISGAPSVAAMYDKSASPEQLDALTAGVIKSAGGKGNVLNQDTVNSIKDSLGKRFDFISRGTSINKPEALQPLDDTLKGIGDKINGPYGAGTDQPATKAIDKMVNNLRAEIATGRISGATYQALTQKGSALQLALQRTNPARPYAIDIKNALDDALEASQPQLASALKLARHQWNNSILAEDLANETTGKVDPTKLAREVEKRFDTTGKASERAQAVGAPADIGVLGEAASNFLSHKAAVSSPVGNKVAHYGWPLALGIAADHFAAPYAEHAITAYPGLTLGAIAAAGLGAGGKMAGKGMNTGAYRNLLLSGAHVPDVNPLIPTVSQFYNGDHKVEDMMKGKLQ